MPSIKYHALVTFLLLTLSCVAFVPATKLQIASSGNMMIGEPKSAFTPSVQGTVPTRSSTSLSMMVGNGNLIDRFARVMKSNINKLVASIENPEKVIVQAVDDMQTDLVKVRQAYAEATAGQRRLERQSEQADAVANDWYNRAQLALSRHNEGLAREALVRRQVELEKAAMLQSQMDAQGEAINKLYTAMTALEVKIRVAVSKKEQLVVRVRTAKRTAQVNDMLSGLTGKTSMDAFNRMELKVEALEVAAELSAEIALVSGGTTKDSVEFEFRLLEQSSKVDEEFEKMKGRLNETKMMLGASVAAEEEIRERVSIPVARGETIYVGVGKDSQ